MLNVFVRPDFESVLSIGSFGVIAHRLKASSDTVLFIISDTFPFDKLLFQSYLTVKPNVRFHFHFQFRSNYEAISSLLDNMASDGIFDLNQLDDFTYGNTLPRLKGSYIYLTSSSLFTDAFDSISFSSGLDSYQDIINGIISPDLISELSYFSAIDFTLDLLVKPYALVRAEDALTRRISLKSDSKPYLCAKLGLTDGDTASILHSRCSRPDSTFTISPYQDSFSLIIPPGFRSYLSDSSIVFKPILIDDLSEMVQVNLGDVSGHAVFLLDLPKLVNAVSYYFRSHGFTNLQFSIVNAYPLLVLPDLFKFIESDIISLITISLRNKLDFFFSDLDSSLGNLKSLFNKDIFIISKDVRGDSILNDAISQGLVSLYSTCKEIS